MSSNVNFPSSSRSFACEANGSIAIAPSISIEKNLTKYKVTDLYRNNLKNRNFGKEDPQNVHSERGSIAERQGPSESANCEENPMQPKTDSSSCFGIIAWVLSLSQFCDLKFKYQ